jgi:hypothetical protein
MLVNISAFTRIEKYNKLSLIVSELSSIVDVDFVDLRSQIIPGHSRCCSHQLLKSLKLP